MAGVGSGGGVGGRPCDALGGAAAGAAMGHRELVRLRHNRRRPFTGDQQRGRPPGPRPILRPHHPAVGLAGGHRVQPSLHRLTQRPPRPGLPRGPNRRLPGRPHHRPAGILPAVPIRFLFPPEHLVPVPRRVHGGRPFVCPARQRAGRRIVRPDPDRGRWAAGAGRQVAGRTGCVRVVAGRPAGRSHSGTGRLNAGKGRSGRGPEFRARALAPAG